MLLLQLLFGSTAHFIIIVCSAFTFFAAGLLYFDATSAIKRNQTTLFRSAGFFLLATTMAIHASSISLDYVIAFAEVTKIIGLILVLISLVNEPVLHRPSRHTVHALTMTAFSTMTWSLVPVSTALFLLVAITYLRKATEGLEKQLKGPGVAFLFFAVAEAFRIPLFWSGTPVIFWSKILSEFGIVWNIQHILQFAGTLIFAVWIWGYIRFQLRIQLVVTTMALSLIVFVTTTVFYTFLLLKNMETDALSHLATDVQVLNYALDSLKEQSLAHAKAVAQDSSIKEAFQTNNRELLYSLSSDYMVSQETDSLVIASSSGQVVMRAEDAERTNDNIRADPIVSVALSGQGASSISYIEAVLAPRVLVVAAAPITSNGVVTGVVVTGFTIDSAFVDGVKEVTGLDTTIFGHDKRAATTFVAPDGKSRFVGTYESNQTIIKTVLEEGKPYVGPARVLNQPYYTAYAPLTTYDGKAIGMLFVGRRQDALINIARHSIYLTFSGSVILMSLLLIPAYFFARYLQKQADA